MLIDQNKRSERNKKAEKYFNEDARDLFANKQKIDWKLIEERNDIRLAYLKTRKERWINKILQTARIDRYPEEKLKMGNWDGVGAIYALVNIRTKKIYIGTKNKNKNES